MVAILEPQERTENQEPAQQHRHLHLVDGFSSRVGGIDLALHAPVEAPALDAVERVGAALAATTYRRRRVVVFAAIALMVWLTVSTAVTVASWATGPSAPVLPVSDEPIVHVVQAGDTFWSIAREYQPTGDVRPFVDRLVSLNGGTDVSIGQQLVVSR